MNPVIKARWVKALRSGDYQQIRGYLHANDRFCCLGVLCEVVKNDLDLDINTDPEGRTYYNGEHTYLPFKVVERIGISATGTVIKRRYNANDTLELALGGSTLSMLNDRGFTFDQIADIIDYFF